MKDQIELLRGIAECLYDALENNTITTLGQAIERMAEGLIEDADDMEEHEND